VDTMR
jgi:hypothetical protein